MKNKMISAQFFAISWYIYSTCLIDGVSSFWQLKPPRPRDLRKIGPLGWLMWPQSEYFTAKLLIAISQDVIRDTDVRIKALPQIILQAQYSAPFEIGYMTFVCQDKYRKMVDRYNASEYNIHRFTLMEQAIYLEEIEALFWEIQNLVYMTHEIERKYIVKSKLNEPYVETTPWPTTRTRRRSKKLRPKRGRKTTPYTGARSKWRAPTSGRLLPQNWQDMQAWARDATTTRVHTRWWWPLEYGWEIDYWWGPPTTTPKGRYGQHMPGGDIKDRPAG